MNSSEPEPAIASDVRETILERLRAVERREGVRILFAIESGSRAWGFPSPDSDYDVRFVYARPVHWYLSTRPARDIIELPIDDPYDINGWDIRKALGLIIKPNPVLLEWLSSPIRYIWNETVCGRLIDLSQRTAHGPACLQHYRRLGKRQWATYMEGKEQVNLKKYLYVVRPAMAVRWARLHPTIIPPMNFQQLSAGVDLPSDLTAELDRLLMLKSQAKETGDGPRFAIIDAFIEQELAWAEQAAQKTKEPGPDPRSAADELFRAIVKEMDAHAH